MIKFITTSLFMIFCFLYSSSIYGETWNVQVMNFQFIPANLPNVHVGDSIKWTWVSGDHTTTSTAIPMGAPVWDAPITASFTSFTYVVSVPGNYAYVCTPHAPGMAGTFAASPIGIVPISGSVPSDFALGQNFPNPFNPVTNIKIDIPNEAFVNLTIYDILGNEVEVLLNQKINAGSYNVDWNASYYPSGIYIYKINAGEFTATRKMMLVK